MAYLSTATHIGLDAKTRLITSILRLWQFKTMPYRYRAESGW
jgi:hypothetical protein